MSTITRRLARSLALLCVGALLSVPSHAAERIKLADGTVLEGDAIDYDESSKQLTFQLTTGQKVKYGIDQLDKQSVYQVTQSKVEKSNAQGQIKLGNYARDIGLYAHAARHYRYALAADPSVEKSLEPEIAVLKREAAAWGMDNARKAVERNDLPDAEKWLKKIIDKLPDMPEAQQAQAMLDRYYARSMETKAVPASAPNNLLETDLKDGKRYYDSMVEKTKAGLTQDRAGSKAIKSWESAIKDGERALKELDKADGKYTDSATKELLSGYRKAVDDQIAEIHLHMASLYMTRTDYNKAMGETNMALAINAKNAEALAMRSRIENAAGNGWRWW